MCREKDLFFYLYILLFIACGSVFIYWITPFGPGVSPDSTVYLSGAKSLISGKGFSALGIPITHFPPLYSLFLVATGFFNSDIVKAARLFNALLFGLNLGLVALAVYYSTGRSYLATTLAAASFLASAPFFELHAWARSEPLFITFLLISIFFLAFYSSRSETASLIMSSLFLGFTFLTRYIGIAFLPAALVMVFKLGSDRKVRERILHSLIYAGVACAPLGIFLLRNALIAGTTTNRSFTFHPISVNTYLSEFGNVMFIRFLFPVLLPDETWKSLLVLLLILLTILLVVSVNKNQRNNSWHSFNQAIALSCLLFFLSYFVFLFISICFMDASTAVDPRILSPLFVLMIIGLFSFIWIVSKTITKPWVWGIFLLLITLSIALKTPEAVQRAAMIRNNGLGFTSLKWRNVESMEFIKSLPGDMKIYSNGADVVNFLTGKQSAFIPEKESPTSHRINPGYKDQVEAMCKTIIENHAVLLYSNNVPWRWYYPSQEELETSCQMPVLRSFSDGILYGRITE